MELDVHEQLVDIVEKPTWKTLLVETVQTQDMDPWDIDVEVLAGKYIEKINSMQKLDFHIPANAVLCSAILVRFKSDSWSLFPQEEFEDQLEEDTNWELIIEGQRVPELVAGRRVTSRKVTIDELINAVEDVMEKEKRRALRKATRQVVPQELVNIAFEDLEDFEKYLDVVYQRVKKNMDSQNMCLFSQLLNEKTKEETIKVLLPLLHLATNNQVAIWQEKSFDEIFVILGENGSDKKHGLQETC